ncbi:hypothetical protein AB1K54_03375 [Microbacterium sp. BWT-B31]|uniref:hypothetical protein n=1 Tax=Microbacterium sp. BWT-B31 TaxID=3232072 RepID=UPI003529045E
MWNDELRAADGREYADRIRALREATRRQRHARRHARWRALADIVLSIPPGIAMRIGG